MEPATTRLRAGFLGKETRRKEIAMTRMVPIAGLAALAVLGAGCTNDYYYGRPYYGYSQGYAAPGYGYYAPARYNYGYPRYGYYSPYYSSGPYYGSSPGITFSATFPQG
jgi:hypothetical protein